MLSNLEDEFVVGSFQDVCQTCLFLFYKYISQKNRIVSHTPPFDKRRPKQSLAFVGTSPIDDHPPRCLALLGPVDVLNN